MKKSIEDILLANPPVQFQILEKLLDLFVKTHALESAYVRGSLSNNTYDRTSDVDLVLSIFEEDYIHFVNSIDTLVEENFNGLFPGWFDRIVPQFGGIGFVYLIPLENKIFQTDLYITPSKSLSKLLGTPSIKKVFDSQSKKDILDSVSEEVNSFIQNFRIEDKFSYRAMFVESIVLSFLISKRIKRSQHYLNYSETVLLNQTFRNIVRLSFDPEHLDYGWYHLENNLYKVARGEYWLNNLNEVVVNGQPTHNFNSLKKMMNLISELISEIAPDSIKDLEGAFQTYMSKLRL